MDRNGSEMWSVGVGRVELALVERTCPLPATKAVRTGSCSETLSLQTIILLVDQILTMVLLNSN